MSLHNIIVMFVNKGEFMLSHVETYTGTLMHAEARRNTPVHVDIYQSMLIQVNIL